MEIYNENIEYENPLLSVKIFRAVRTRDYASTRWHYHKELEILVILEGRLDVWVDDEFYPMQPGDVVLIGSNQLHRDATFEHFPLTYIVFQFDLQHYFGQSTMQYYRMFAETAFPLSHLNYIFAENSAARKKVGDSVGEIYREWQQKAEGLEIAVTILIKQIVLDLLRNDTRKLLHSHDRTELIRLKPVLDYIEQHIHSRIQVEDVSKVANISYYYFVKYFKKAIGMSFLEYVNYRKIKCAERLLLTKDISVAQVGESVGMPNMAHFYKVFKKFNQCSPNEFRKKMSENTDRTRLYPSN